MKLFCTTFLLSLAIIPGLISTVDTNKGFPVQNNFSNSSNVNTDPAGKKNHVRLYPNPTLNGTITVNSTLNQPLHLYVFDLEGTLLHRIVLKGKEQRKITNLKKGTYMYDVFKNDESIEQGKIIAK